MTPQVRRHPVFSGIALLVAVGMLAAMLSFVAQPRVAQAQTESLSTAQVTPESALVYAAVNLDRESGQWALADELLDRAGLGEALDQAVTDADVGAAEQATLDAIFGGEAAIVLSEIPESGDLSGDDAAGTLTDPTALAEGAAPQGFAIILAVSDPDAAFDVLQEQIQQDAEESGAEVESTDYNGVTIESVAPADEFSSGTALARVEDFVVFATLPGDIEPIVDTANGDVAPLTEEENFTNLRGGLNEEFLAFGFINGPALLTGLQESNPEEFAAVEDDVTAVLQSYTGFVTWADDPGFRLDTLSIQSEGNEFEAGETLDGSLAEQVPADSLVFFSGLNLGSTPGLDALGLILAQTAIGEEPGTTAPEGEDPEAYAEDVHAQAEEVLGFNIQTDFIEQMVGPYAFAISASDLLSGTPNVSSVLASGTEDPSVVAGVVDQIGVLLTSAIGEAAEVSTREVDGSTVQVIDASASGFPLIIELGVVGEDFILGVGEGLDQFVNGPDEPLSESENYQAAMGELPQEYTGVSYVNLERVIALLEEFNSTFGGQVSDADPACGEFETQEDAQAAYDEDSFENFALDQDFDGQACEDFFAPATPGAETGSPYANIKALAGVSFVSDGMMGTSSILSIADE